MKASVLLVDDTNDVREAIAALLQNSGCTVLQAKNGSDGLALVARHGEAIDVLISDIVMPGMSGTALVEDALRRCPHLGVLLMTGYAGQPAVDVDYLVMRKPFSAAELLENLRMALKRRSTNGA